MGGILITGSKGQLGSELSDIEKGFGGLPCLFHDVDTLDITDRDALARFFNTHKPAFVVNCAAYTAVDKAESEPEKAELINATAVANLADECSKHNAYLIHVSTDYVFDGTSYRPLTENLNVNPTSVYGKTKEKGEQYVLKNKKGIVIRTSWLYSYYGHNFVKTMLRLARERGELNVVFDQIGTPTNAADLALAIQVIVNRIHANNDSFIGGIYHYSNEGVCSWFDFAKAITLISNIPCKVNPIESKDYPLPAPRPFYSVLNKAKIKSTWCIEIPHWLDSLRGCLAKLNG